MERYEGPWWWRGDMEVMIQAERTCSEILVCPSLPPHTCTSLSQINYEGDSSTSQRFSTAGLSVKNSNSATFSFGNLIWDSSTREFLILLIRSLMMIVISCSMTCSLMTCHCSTRPCMHFLSVFMMHFPTHNFLLQLHTRSVHTDLPFGGIRPQSGQWRVHRENRQN